MKLFDDSLYIDKTVTTNYDKQKWKKAFQRLCDSDEIREESSLNGLNACGYWFACDYCEGSDKKTPCANALVDYCKERDLQIDFKNTDRKYLEKMLRKE